MEENNLSESLTSNSLRNEEPGGHGSPFRGRGGSRVLITGAAGFLGSHLCDRFIKEGMHVIGMDNLITGDLKNIEHLFKLKEFEFYNCDVSKFIYVPRNACPIKAGNALPSLSRIRGP